MRVDTTVVESNVHYPTDSGLLQDGARVMTRSMQKDRKESGWIEAKNPQPDAQCNQAGHRDRARSKPQGRGVIHQTRARLFRGVTQFPEKIVSLFEPHTELFTKAKPVSRMNLAAGPGARSRNQITHYEVFDKRPSDQRLLGGAVKAQQQKLGRVPRLVAADAGFYSRENEQTVQQMGVAYVSIPNRSTRSEERRNLQKKRWFKAGQKWRRLRRPHQRSQTTTWTEPLPVSRARGHAALGRAWRDCR